MISNYDGNDNYDDNYDGNNSNNKNNNNNNNNKKVGYDYNDDDDGIIDFVTGP